MEAAALFGVALAAKSGDVDVHIFASTTAPHPVHRGDSVLRQVERLVARMGEVDHGTEMAYAIRRTYRDHGRVFIFSDMQAFAGPYSWNQPVSRASVSTLVPADKPIYAFNLAGYAPAIVPSGRGLRYEIGGLTDHTFQQVPLLERGLTASWPWEYANPA